MTEPDPTAAINYATRNTRHRPQRFATTAFVFGVIGLVVPLVGIVAIVLGFNARERASRAGFVPARRSGFAISLGLLAIILHLAATGIIIRHQVLESRKIYCRMNIEMIWNGFIVYSNDHRGALPPDFATIIQVQDLVPGVFICPSRRREFPATFFTDEVAARKAGDLDYVMVHGFLEPTPQERKYVGSYPGPMLIERLSNHRNGAHVLWTDGVVFESKPNFLALVDRLRAQSLITNEEYQFLIAE